MQKKFKLRDVLLVSETDNSGSCPNLLDMERKTNLSKPIKKPVIAKYNPPQRTYKKFYSTGVIETAAHIPIVISTIETEDITSIDFEKGMSNKKCRKYRSASLDRVS